MHAEWSVVIKMAKSEYICRICNKETYSWFELYEGKWYYYCNEHKGSRKSKICMYCKDKLTEESLEAGYLDRHIYCIHVCDRRDYGGLCIKCGKLPSTKKTTFYCKLHSEKSKWEGYNPGDDVFCQFCFNKCGVQDKGRTIHTGHEKCVESNNKECEYCGKKRTKNSNHLRCCHAFLDRVETGKCLCCANPQKHDDIYCQVCIDSDNAHVRNVLI